MNEFLFEGKKYRAVPEQQGKKLKCDLCAFGKTHECIRFDSFPSCSERFRKDKRSVYFEEVTINFDRIAESPEALAEQMVYSAFDEFDGEEWFGITGNKIRESFKNKEEAVAATLKWLNDEVEE